jgi:outer membrane protein assembly factor BamB
MPTSVKRTVPALLATVILLATPAIAVGPDEAPENWPQFRGPNGMPVSNNPGLPTSWSTTENVEWVADVPGVGWSSPIVWNGVVYVTAAESAAEMKQPSLGVDFSNEYIAEMTEEGLSNEEIERRINARDTEFPDEVSLSYRLFAFDLESGAPVWDRELHSGPPPVGRHRKNSYMSETPVTDGEAIYVYIAHMGLYAYDLAGAELWSTAMEPHPVYLEFGGGASPAVHGDRIFVLNDSQEGSFIAAFDKHTGEQLWMQAREGLGNQMLRSGWSSPYVWENELRTEIVTVGPMVAISYDLDGNELWRMNGQGMMVCQTPFAWDGHLYLSSGAKGRSDTPLAAIRPGASGDITMGEMQESSDDVLWFDRTGGGTYLPTPVLYNSGVYVLTDKGIFSRHDAKTGARTYQTRIHTTARNFTSSPWAYNGNVFAINEEGDTFVMKAGTEFEFVGINSLDEFVLATPAISGDRLLIRTQSKLYSIRNAN